MESHSDYDFQVAYRQPFLLSLLCVLVLLPHLLLPAVYYSHLTATFLSVYQEYPRAGPLAIGTYPEKSPGPYHDRNSCLICRAASSFQDYGFFALPLAPECSAPDAPVWLAVFISPTPIITNSDFLVSVPRAPPVSL